MSVAKPVHLCANTGPGSSNEIGLDVIKGDLIPDIIIFIRHTGHHADKKGCIGDLVEYGRPGRNDPVLNSKMRNTLVYPITCPIPPVYCSVVQTKCFQLWCNTLCNHRQGVIFCLSRQDNPETGNIFFENLGN